MEAINEFVSYNGYACGIPTAQNSIQIIQKVLLARFRSVATQSLSVPLTATRQSTLIRSRCSHAKLPNKIVIHSFMCSVPDRLMSVVIKVAQNYLVLVTP